MAKLRTVKLSDNQLELLMAVVQEEISCYQYMIKEESSDDELDQLNEELVELQELYFTITEGFD